MDLTASAFDGLAHEPIALVGIACRFPGAANKEQFWRMLQEGRSGIGRYPARRSRLGMQKRALAEAYAVAAGTHEADVYLGVLEDIDCFDNAFFHISDYEARQMDPQQRLSLELVWEALEDAGLRPSDMAGTRTSTYAASVGTSYWASRLAYQNYQQLLDALDGYAMTGAANSILSGRVAYHFDFRGEAVTVDSACSSSLTATHLACQSLWSGTADSAVVVGVNAILTADAVLGLAKGKVLSPDGRCFPFSRAASGYGRSEGAGALILLPLSKAVERGLDIYCCILSSGANNDGRSGGHLLAPSVTQQLELIEQTWRGTPYSLHDAQYVEAHGTGTQRGDAIEITAIAKACDQRFAAQGRLLIGSVKSNISHTEAAAGVASVIKTALAMKYGVIPASIGVSERNDRADWGVRVDVCRTPSAWEQRADGLRLAGVNAFGFSGTNVHLALGWHRELMRTEQGRRSGSSAPLVMFVSAHKPAVLRQRLLDLAALLATDSSPDWRDVCYTLAHHRDHLPVRTAFLVDSRDSALQQIDAAIEQMSQPGDQRALVSGQSRRCLLFWYRQGIAHWLSRHRDVVESVFDAQPGLAEFERELRAKIGCSYAELLRDVDFAVVDATSPIVARRELLITLTECLLLRQWRACGIEPDIYWVEAKSKVSIGITNGKLSLSEGIDELAAQERRRAPRATRFLDSDFQFLSCQGGSQREISIVTVTGSTPANSPLLELFEENTVLHILNQRGDKRSFSKGRESANGAGIDRLSVPAMLETLMELYREGVAVNTHQLSIDGRLVRLPVYPFEKVSHWFQYFPIEGDEDVDVQVQALADE